MPLTLIVSSPRRVHPNFGIFVLLGAYRLEVFGEYTSMTGSAEGKCLPKASGATPVSLDACGPEPLIRGRNSASGAFPRAGCSGLSRSICRWALAKCI